jgi:hypothetical protein
VSWVSFTEPPIASAALPATDRSRWSRVVGLAGLVAATGYVFLMDPDEGGAYPLCPSKALLGIDCPACGGLRGTHALLHGRLGEALDHNLLLPLFLAAIAVVAGSWMLPLIGRPERHVRLPRWLVVGLVVAIGAFTLARNLPGPHFAYLASDA